MKSFFKVLSFAALAALMFFSVAACKNSTGGSDSPAFMEMARINGKTFNMGSTTNEDPRGSASQYSREQPQHPVKISSFYMGKYQVTQAQYKSVMDNADPSYFFKGDNRPVVAVSWYDAIVFCNKLSIREGLTPVYKINGSTNPDDWGTVPTSSDATWNTVTATWTANGYRLPTEAEWEFACRADTFLRFNNNKNADAYDTSMANYGQSTDGSGGGTKPVGSYPRNAWDLFDMHGNVNEWCWDWYDDPSGSNNSSYYTTCKDWSTNNNNQPYENPKGPDSGTNRAWRGGAWSTAKDPQGTPSAPNGMQRGSAFRQGSLPNTRYGWGDDQPRSYDTGFRVARSL
jgi:formylglycine-generating enzyme required for sulfatase activity